MAFRVLRFAIVCCCGTSLFAAQEVEPNRKPAANAPAADRGDDAAPRVRFRIAKETTRLTEPLTDAGFVDYAAALNAEYSKGVTHENNAAVVLIEVMPSLVASRQWLDDICPMLDVPVPPEEGEYWDEGDVDSDLLRTAMAGPWPKKRYPQVAEWLDANEKFFERLIDASSRPRFFVPVYAPDFWMEGDDVRLRSPLVIAGVPAHAGSAAARALTARAMLRVEEARFAEARRDLIAAHRWARLCGQGATIFDWYVSVSLESSICRAEVAFALQENLPGAELVALRKGLAELPARQPLHEVTDRFERYEFLDSVRVISEGPVIRAIDLIVRLTAAQQPENSLRFVALVDFEALGLEIVGIGYEIGTNWGGILRAGNDWYDHCVEVLRTPHGSTRRKRLEELEEEFRVARGSFPDKVEEMNRQLFRMLRLRLQGHRLYVAWPVASLSVLGEVMHKVLVNMLLRSPVHAAHSEYSSEADFAMTRIAIELADYRREHEAFPESLGDLVPGRLKQQPLDPYSDAPYRYRREGAGFALYSVGKNGRDERGEQPDPNVYDRDRLDDIAIHWPPRKE